MGLTRVTLIDGRVRLFGEAVHRLAPASLVDRLIRIEARAVGGQKIVDGCTLAGTRVSTAKRRGNLADGIAVTVTKLVPVLRDLGCALLYRPCRGTGLHHGASDGLR